MFSIFFRYISGLRRIYLEYSLSWRSGLKFECDFKIFIKYLKIIFHFFHRICFCLSIYLNTFFDHFFVSRFTQINFLMIFFLFLNLLEPNFWSFFMFLFNLLKKLANSCFTRAFLTVLLFFEEILILLMSCKVNFWKSERSKILFF